MSDPFELLEQSRAELASNKPTKPPPPPPPRAEPPARLAPEHRAAATLQYLPPSFAQQNPTSIAAFAEVDISEEEYAKAINDMWARGSLIEFRNLWESSTETQREVVWSSLSSQERDLLRASGIGPSDRNWFEHLRAAPGAGVTEILKGFEWIEQFKDRITRANIHSQIDAGDITIDPELFDPKDPAERLAMQFARAVRGEGKEQREMTPLGIAGLIARAGPGFDQVPGTDLEIAGPEDAVGVNLRATAPNPLTMLGALISSYAPNAFGGWSEYWRKAGGVGEQSWFPQAVDRVRNELGYDDEGYNFVDQIARIASAGMTSSEAFFQVEDDEAWQDVLVDTISTHVADPAEQARLFNEAITDPNLREAVKTLVSGRISVGTVQALVAGKVPGTPEFDGVSGTFDVMDAFLDPFLVGGRVKKIADLRYALSGAEEISVKVNRLWSNSAVQRMAKQVGGALDDEIARRVVEFNLHATGGDDALKQFTLASRKARAEIVPDAALREGWERAGLNQLIKNDPSRYSRIITPLSEFFSTDNLLTRGILKHADDGTLAIAEDFKGFANLVGTADDLVKEFVTSKVGTELMTSGQMGGFLMRVPTIPRVQLTSLAWRKVINASRANIDLLADTPFTVARKLKEAGKLSEEEMIRVGFGATLGRVGTVAAEQGILPAAAVGAASVAALPGRFLKWATRTHHRGPINLLDNRSVTEIERFAAFLPEDVGKHLVARYAAATTGGERYLIARSITEEVLHAAGANQWKGGREIVQNFLDGMEESYQQYMRDPELSIHLRDGVRMPVAIHSGQLSTQLALPDFRLMWGFGKRASINHALTLQPLLNSQLAHTFMSRLWAPLVLFRFGFAFRAGGDEAIQFIMREGFNKYAKGRAGLTIAADVPITSRLKTWGQYVTSFLPENAQLTLSRPYEVMGEYWGRRVASVVEDAKTLGDFTRKNVYYNLLRPLTTKEYIDTAKDLISDKRIINGIVNSDMVAASGIRGLGSEFWLQVGNTAQQSQMGLDLASQLKLRHPNLISQYTRTFEEAGMNTDQGIINLMHQQRQFAEVPEGQRLLSIVTDRGEDGAGVSLLDLYDAGQLTYDELTDRVAAAWVDEVKSNPELSETFKQFAIANHTVRADGKGVLSEESRRQMVAHARRLDGELAPYDRAVAIEDPQARDLAAWIDSSDRSFAHQEQQLDEADIAFETKALNELVEEIAQLRQVDPEAGSLASLRDDLLRSAEEMMRNRQTYDDLDAIDDQIDLNLIKAQVIEQVESGHFEGSFSQLRNQLSEPLRKRDEIDTLMGRYVPRDEAIRQWGSHLMKWFRDVAFGPQNPERIRQLRTFIDDASLRLDPSQKLEALNRELGMSLPRRLAPGERLSPEKAAKVQQLSDEITSLQESAGKLTTRERERLEKEVEAAREEMGDLERWTKLGGEEPGLIPEVVEALQSGRSLTRQEIRDLKLVTLPRAALGPNVELTKKRNLFSQVLDFGFSEALLPVIDWISRGPIFLSNAVEQRVIVRQLLDETFPEQAPVFKQMWGRDIRFSDIAEEIDRVDEELKALAETNRVQQEAHGIQLTELTTPEDALRILRETEMGELIYRHVIPAIKKHMPSDEMRSARRAKGARSVFTGPGTDWHVLTDAMTPLERANTWYHDQIMSGATARTIPWIDSEPMASFLAGGGRWLVPFWWAEERFIKRLVGSTVFNPAGMKRLQLAYSGLQHTGFLNKNERGEDVFTYPGTGLAEPVVAALLGEMGVVNLTNFTLEGAMKYAIPGVDNIGSVQLGPLPAIPLREVMRRVPALQGVISTALGPVASNLERADWSLLMPSFLVDLMYLPNAAENVSSAYLQAIQMAVYNGLDDEEGILGQEVRTPQDIEDFLDKIERHTQVILGVRSAYRLFSASPPEITFPERNELRRDLQDLINDLGFFEGTAQFLKDNPDATAFTISLTESASGGPLPATRPVFEFMEDHPDFLEDHPSAFSYFVPVPTVYGEDIFYDQAWFRSLASEARRRKADDPDAFYRELKFAEAAPKYFQHRDEMEIILAAVKGTPAAQEVNNRWKNWADEYKRAHPIFAEELENLDRHHERMQRIDAMREAVNDPNAPQGERLQMLQTMVRAWDDYQNLINLDEIAGPRGADARRAIRERYVLWGEEVAMKHPWLRPFWVGTIRRELEMSEADIAVLTGEQSQPELATVGGS